LEATVLYADLKESSKLASDLRQTVAAKIYRSYLYCVARLISESRGTVTAYDGDRVMGIFIGGTKNSDASICALKINHMMDYVLSPKLAEHFKSLNDSGFEISHSVGIDTGSFLAIRAGQRSANDLVWVGRPPNLAARLSEYRRETYTTFISDEVFVPMHESAKFGGQPKELMWTELPYTYLGENTKIHGSSLRWTP